ncbi:hypothetical protein F4806DRAFT_500083 [Annulohypoxylon nitens]|nr:hypothetical protein F4806DRAFT_500083 [Annulohypoxylon nitens]
MAPAQSREQSTETHQGSVGSGSNSQLVEPAEYASYRVARFVGDADAPVNATLAMRALSQSGAPSRSGYAQLLSSIDNLFGGQHQGGATAPQTPEATGSIPMGSSPGNGQHLSGETAPRGVGSRSGNIRSTSAGSSATAGRQ